MECVREVETEDVESGFMWWSYCQCGALKLVGLLSWLRQHDWVRHEKRWIACEDFTNVYSLSTFIRAWKVFF
jgi:hypothetical protein